MSPFDLGKYAVYVLPAYGVTAAVVIGLVWDSLARARRWRRETERREKALEARK
jgi:heme exporter protein D